MKRFTMLFFALLTGCAGAGGGNCGPDWFSIGQREGMLNAGLNPERHAARCGGSIDTARYQEGYRDGMSRRASVPSF